MVKGARTSADALCAHTGERSDLCVREARAGRAGDRCTTRVASSAFSRRAVHRARLSLGADVAIATSSLGEYCFIIGAIAMVRQASSPPPDPSASAAARPAKLRDHLLIRATGWSPPRCGCPSPGLRPPCRGGGTSPQGPGGMQTWGGGHTRITSNTRRRERMKVGDSSKQTAGRSGRRQRDVYARDGGRREFRAGSLLVTRRE